MVIAKKSSLKKKVKLKPAVKPKVTAKVKLKKKLLSISKSSVKKPILKSKVTSAPEVAVSQPSSDFIGDAPLPTQVKLPKMAKLVDDPCYGVLFNTLPECAPCYLRRSCQSTYQSQKKKAKQIQSGFVRRPIEKKYKMTEAYRPWR